MNQIIIQAIKMRTKLTFSYHGHPRQVDPYIYGIDTKGHIALLVYQTGGSSASGRIPEWRIFHESGISQLRSAGTQFAKKLLTGATKKDSFATIFAEI